VRDWPSVRDALAGAGIAWVLAGLVLAGAGMVAIAVPWSTAIRLLGGDVRGLRHVAWYFVGEIGKYLPGGVWPVLGRSEMARRRGVRAAAAYGSVALSLAALYLAAMAGAVALVPLRLGDGVGTGWWWAAAVLLPLGLLALHPRAVAAGLRLAERVARRPLEVTVPSWGRSLGYVTSYLPAWALICLATWAVARALTPDASLGGVAFATLLAWIAGFLAVPVPGGVGVREVVFIAAAGLDPGVGAATALVARVLFMAVDVVGALVAGAWVTHHEGAVRASTTLDPVASDVE
jgi:uncharacterized membrane protein YbhN (UPF0104 family)